MNEQGWETTADLLAAAVAMQPADDPVSVVMLTKWRRAGLLPGPIAHRGKGKKHGSVWFYPPGSVAQLRRLLEMRAEPGRFKPEAALWRLWWEGWPVDQTKINDGLWDAVQWWEDAVTKVVADPAAVADRLATGKLPAGLAAMRERVVPKFFRLFAGTLTTVVAGLFSSFLYDPEDAQGDVEVALGLDQVSWQKLRMVDVLRVVSAGIKPAALKAALFGVSDEQDIRTARDEIRELLNFVRNISYLVAQLGVPDSLGGSQELAPFTIAAALPITPDMLPILAVMWLSFRRAPMLRKGYQQLRPAMDMIAGLRAQYDALSPEALAQLASNKVKHTRVK